MVEFFYGLFFFDVNLVLTNFMNQTNTRENMGYLSSSCYEKIKNLEGKKIGKVVYYQWKNLASDDNFKSLDWIEINMQDETKIVLHYGVDNDGIELVDFDFDEELNKIETEFNNQATLVRENATLEIHWFPILNKEIRKVKVFEKNGNKLNNSIIFEFSDNHQVEISTQEEGMLVEFYEE